MKKLTRIAFVITAAIAALIAVTSNTGCGIYKFNEGSIPDSIKTIKVNAFENRAQYINPQLAPSLTEKLRQKFLSQTKASLTNSDNADWELSCEIRDYSLSTSAISGQQAANNRITVGIHIVLNDRKADKISEHDVSKPFEFKGNQTLQQAESTLKEEIIRTMTDEIFNKLLPDW